jgi:hypothetical protein
MNKKAYNESRAIAAMMLPYIKKMGWGDQDVSTPEAVRKMRLNVDWEPYTTEPNKLRSIGIPALGAGIGGAAGYGIGSAMGEGAPFLGLLGALGGGLLGHNIETDTNPHAQEQMARGMAEESLEEDIKDVLMKRLHKKAYIQGYTDKEARGFRNMSPETIAMIKGSRPGIRLGAEYNHIGADREVSATKLKTYPELGIQTDTNYIKGKSVKNRRTNQPEGSKVADADTQATPRKVEGK